MKLRILLICLAGAAAGLPAALAQVDVTVSAEIRLGRVLPPPPPEVVVVDEVGPPGPPPWAETHWYRRSHAYYYYPGCDVYYRPDDKVWFYLEGGTWRVAAQLPTNIRIDFGRSVSLTLETDRPYVYHEKVVRYYPANYFAKVRFKNAHDNRAVDRKEHPDRKPDKRDDDDDQDRGKSHGKGHGRGPKD